MIYLLGGLCFPRYRKSGVQAGKIKGYLDAIL